MLLVKFRGNTFWKLILLGLLGFHPVAMSGASEYDFLGIYRGASTYLSRYLISGKLTFKYLLFNLLSSSLLLQSGGEIVLVILLVCMILSILSKVTD